MSLRSEYNLESMLLSSARMPVVLSPPMSFAWIAERLRLGRQLPDDPDFLGYAHPPDHPATPAAVLVPLINRPEGITVVLTQRTAHLNDHAGQISFPGGRVDAGDVDRVHTALRETEEETGLAREGVRVIGQLSDYDIPSGFRVTPVVGWIEPPVSFDPDPFEVAEVFEVPLTHFLDPANHQRHSDEVRGRRRNYYAMPYRGRNIWGATAGMLYSLYRVLAQEA
jgi:8-oxo-dGTP pyrophosphatase MutT (NUDIX family)